MFPNLFQNFVPNLVQNLNIQRPLAYTSGIVSDTLHDIFCMMFYTFPNEMNYHSKIVCKPFAKDEIHHIDFQSSTVSVNNLIYLFKFFPKLSQVRNFHLNLTGDFNELGKILEHRGGMVKGKRSKQYGPLTPAKHITFLPSNYVDCSYLSNVKYLAKTWYFDGMSSKHLTCLRIFAEDVHKLRDDQFPKLKEISIYGDIAEKIEWCEPMNNVVDVTVEMVNVDLSGIAETFPYLECLYAWKGIVTLNDKTLPSSLKRFSISSKSSEFDEALVNTKCCINKTNDLHKESLTMEGYDKHGQNNKTRNRTLVEWIRKKEISDKQKETRAKNKLK